MATAKEIMTPEIQYGLIFLFVIIIYTCKTFLTLLIKKVWKKNIDTEYITTEKCEEHRMQMELADKQRHDTLHSELKNINAQFKIFNSLFIKAIMTNSSLSEEAKTDAIIQLKNGVVTDV